MSTYSRAGVTDLPHPVIGALFCQKVSKRSLNIPAYHDHRHESVQDAPQDRTSGCTVCYRGRGAPASVWFSDRVQRVGLPRHRYVSDPDVRRNLRQNL